jgi:DNA-(apurinic or apyrimidinic site) lyase
VDKKVPSLEKGAILLPARSPRAPFERAAINSFAAQGPVEAVYRINRSKVATAASFLADAEVRQLLDAAEAADPQMRAIEEIAKRYGRFSAAAFYALGVAAISYQLSAKGEVHWRLAASYAREDPLADLRRFASSSPSLRFARSARLSRVEKLARLWPPFEARLGEYSRDLELLRREIASALSADADSKTVVFAVKMFYYTAKAFGIRVEVPPRIPLPVDRRVCLISLASGVVEDGPPTLENARRLLSEAPRLVATAWSEACEPSGVPPLRLDALLWLLGGCYEEGGDPSRAAELAAELFPPLPPRAASFVRFLLGLSP